MLFVFDGRKRKGGRNTTFDLILMLNGAGAQIHMDVFDNIAAVLNSFYSKLLIIAVPVAVLAIAFCAFKMFLASDPQSVKSAKNWLITIAIGLLIILAAPALVNTIKGLLVDGGLNGTTTTSP